MATMRSLLVFLAVAAAALVLPSSAQSCSSLTLSNSRNYLLCNSLSRLSSSLHWTYHASNGTVDIAYRATQSTPGWIAWGINPTTTRMVNTQALVAFVSSSSGSITAYPTSIDSYRPSMQSGNLSFAVSGVTATNSDGVMTIYATITLPNNSTQVNHVWQASTSFNDDVPGQHSPSGDNILSYGTLNLLSGESASSATNNVARRRNVHGVLNAVSWGLLMPLGVIIARYLRVFKSADPAWFYLHVGCQCTAYILGVAGWGTGLKLGSDSVGVKHTKHRSIGIALFCLATLQVFALFLRPNKDHKRRIFWNVYHHAVGYAVISLSIVNVFEGFKVLDRERSWRRAYIAVIATLAGVAAFLEVVTWVVVLRRRSCHSEKVLGGAVAANGHHGRQGA
ncbi:unnamed protein product [Spirodela intermedia]|uniref:Cytochrome b561 and DOMON domain-containing protein n=1 Tax=Spirodela intermedia TaxID=51605 RepID=A0A7I8KPT2_SPIIN|nr:unnamed protein product [Spirodela intermedia]